MASPMPRDSLGRIVYAGDVLCDGLAVMRIARRAKCAGRFKVDLAASPPRTNHERYFADLGTRDEVAYAFGAINCQADGIGCFECPFELIAGECCYWPYWLDERAVV